MRFGRLTVCDKGAKWRKLLVPNLLIGNASVQPTKFDTAISCALKTQEESSRAQPGLRKGFCLT